MILSLKEYDIISFDIFDTLLIRPYSDPIHLLDHIEIFTGAEGFKDARIDAERIARKKANINHKEDVTFDEIYQEMPDVFIPLKSTELEFESKLLKVRPEGFELYNQAVKEGKKIALISDMYLPKTFLETVLKKNGIKKWDFFYLSSEKGKAKYTGALFKAFLEETHSKPEKILHIGDSWESDVINAQKAGLKAHHLPKTINVFLDSIPFQRLKKVSNDNLTLSLLFGVLAEKFAQRKELLNSPAEYWEDFGYAMAGPVYWGFSEFVRSQIKENEIRQCLFLARDCFILKKIFDLFKMENVRHFYVYAQRLIHARCLLKWGDEHNSDVVLGLLKEKNPQINIPHLKNYEEKNAFLEKHLYLLEKDAKENLAESQKYLENLGVDFNTKTALVDSGAATFSAQNLLSHFLKAPILGLYTIANFKNANKKGFHIKTWAKKEEDIFNLTDFIEFMMMSEEAPVIGIRGNRPVYQKNPSKVEVQRGKICALLEKGILSFMDDMVHRLEGLSFIPDAKEINSFIRAFSMNLTRLDTQEFAKISCSSNASHTEYKESLLAKIQSHLYNTKNVYLFKIPLLTVKTSKEKTFVRLFGKIPLLYMENTQDTLTISMWKMPLLGIKKKKQKTYIYLFKVLRLLAIKEKPVG